MILSTIFRQIDEALTGKWPQPGQYAVACPAEWLPKQMQVVASAPAKKKENVYCANEETRTYHFRDKDFAGPSGNTTRPGAVSTLTSFDNYILQEYADRDAKTRSKRKGKPATVNVNWILAADLKQCWYEEMSVDDAMRECDVSKSYVERYYGAYSTALNNQNSSTIGL